MVSVGRERPVHAARAGAGGPSTGRDGDETRSRRALARSAARHLVAWLPEGRVLPDRVWARRHRIIVRFALIQAIGVTLYGLARHFAVDLCIAYGAVVGLIDPRAVYGTAAERDDPVLTALVDGRFILAACVTHLVAWKTAERHELSDP